MSSKTADLPFSWMSYSMHEPGVLCSTYGVYEWSYMCSSSVPCLTNTSASARARARYTCTLYLVRVQEYSLRILMFCLL